jgi:hypothetical protein
VNNDDADPFNVLAENPVTRRSRAAFWIRTELLIYAVPHMGNLGFINRCLQGPLGPSNLGLSILGDVRPPASAKDGASAQAGK